MLLNMAGQAVLQARLAAADSGAQGEGVSQSVCDLCRSITWEKALGQVRP